MNKPGCTCGNEVSEVAAEISEARGLSPARCEDCLHVFITPKKAQAPRVAYCVFGPHELGPGSSARLCAICREHNTSACRERRARLRRAGLCIFCGQRPPVNRGGALCVVCRGNQSARARARYKPTGYPRGPRPKIQLFR